MVKYYLYLIVDITFGYEFYTLNVINIMGQKWLKFSNNDPLP